MTILIVYELIQIIYLYLRVSDLKEISKPSQIFHYICGIVPKRVTT